MDFKTLLSSQRNQFILLGILGSALFIALVIVVVMYLRSDTASNTRTDAVGSPTDSSFNGTVSNLSGGSTSYRNLKGLTVRINQIETCNPSVVSAFVSVSAESGDVNKSFSQKDVKIYVDGKQLTDFEFKPVNTDKLPLANMLVVDHSGSMVGAPMDNAKLAASQYVDKLKTSDQAGLIQFDDRVEQLVGITTDKASVKNAINGIAPRGDTAVFDALSTAVSAVPDCGRKAVTILTDGDDTASKDNTLASVVEQASKANLPIFSVGVKGDGFDPSAIREISEKTGGQYLEANTPQEISDLYQKINGQLTGQFVANLKLSLKKDNKTHTIKIITNVSGSETGSERSFSY